MALDVATLPLILYRKVVYPCIEHVLHCENIIHIPTYFAIPTRFFSFPMFFLLVHALFSLHSLSIIDILYTVNDIHKTIEHVYYYITLREHHTHSYIVSL